jgi:hypothetical protein
MAGQLVGQRLDVIDAPRTQYHARALREKKPGVASPSPLLAPVMTTTFLSTLSLTILTPARHGGRSATGHLLQVFGVPSPLHRDL